MGSVWSQLNWVCSSLDQSGCDEMWFIRMQNLQRTTDQTIKSK